MRPERWRRVTALFEAAVALPLDERDALLERESAGDEALRREVERLLAADVVSDDVLARLDAGAALVGIDPLVGARLGPYRILERHGAGGMGVVYRARRVDGEFDREVAVKVVRAELIGTRAVERFARERRALAVLDHPDIARLLDAGTAPDGRPYLVMDFVDGVPIDRWCAEHQTSVEERLRLFVTVCRAVQAAHRSLIVHCDLKPNNVLVDAVGRPRVVDFGVARLLARDDSAAPPTIDAPMTPEYASPEQRAGAPLTTSVDVWALGVLLFELLAGKRPVLPVAVTAPPPSGAVDDARPRLRRRLRGDLDRIVQMAMRLEPERRYRSAAELADDVERHLHGLPVVARGDSWAYRLLRFARRRWLPLTAACAALSGLAFGLVAARSGERRALEAALHAQAEAETSQEIAASLLDALLQMVDPNDRQALRAAEERLREQAGIARRKYADRPHALANLLDGLGTAAVRVGAHDVADELLHAALALRERTFGSDHVEVSRSLQSLARWHYARGEIEPAAALLERGLAIQRASFRTPHTNVAAFANDLAACLRGLGRLGEAQALHEEALALREAEAPDSLPVAESANNLAAVFLARGDLERAAALLARSHAIRERILGPGAPATVQAVNNRAIVAWRRGDRASALALFAAAEDGYRKLQAAGRQALAQLLLDHATVLEATGKPEAARQKLDEAVTLLEQIYGPDHARTRAARDRLTRRR